MNTRSIKIAAFILAGLCLFTSCERKEQVDAAGSDVQEMEQEDHSEILSKMSLEEKVGQLFVIRPDALDLSYSNEDLKDNDISGSKTLTSEMKDIYERYPCGGFCLFTKNIDDPTQLKAFTTQLAELGSFKPFLCIDEEGGIVARIANHPSFDVPVFKNMEDIAKTKDPGNAYAAGKEIGRYLAEYGFTVDFAPVADVNTNPDNPVIGARAFGRDPVIAGKMVASFLNGLSENGIYGCIKHFPGHGDTREDSHTGFAKTAKTWDEMLGCEIVSFKAGIDAGTSFVMVSHIACPSITGSDVPSSLSSVIIGKLRDELCYEGIIITDAMDMNAVTDEYTSGEAAVRSILAGADIVLMPYDYREAFDAVLDAVRSGVISEGRLNESVIRILIVKGLLQDQDLGMN